MSQLDFGRTIFRRSWKGHLFLRPLDHAPYYLIKPFGSVIAASAGCLLHKLVLKPPSKIQRRR